MTRSLIWDAASSNSSKNNKVIKQFNDIVIKNNLSDIIKLEVIKIEDDESSYKSSEYCPSPRVSENSKKDYKIGQKNYRGKRNKIIFHKVFK